MRQVARRLRDGRLELVEVPDPGVRPGSVAVRVEMSLISAGTERATMEVASKGLLAKARARPDQAREVIDRVKQNGVRATYELVRQRLDELGPLGYSAAGMALEVGSEVRGIRPGDRVAIAGGGAANHAELDVVPELLCARVPDSVTMEHACFATIGAVAMHGFRRSQAAVGSRIAVIGLGLIGQLAVRIALASGCSVFGVDFDERLGALAEVAGAEFALRDAVGPGGLWAGEADAVLICASAPDSDDPIRLAAGLARDRAPVVAIGDVKLDIPRGPYYEGEHDLRLSRSYGPGRYDPGYERYGHDYPIGYVRWTEQRNMEAFLELVASGRVDPGPLITHRFPFDLAETAFSLLTAPADDENRPIAIVLSYEASRDVAGIAAGPAARAEPKDEEAVVPRWRPTRAPAPRFGLIGAGHFASATIAPGLINAGFRPGAVASEGGLSAEDLRRRFGFDVALADPEELIDSGGLDLVAIATRHDSHAELTERALRAGIPVYVEKPLALDEAGLAAIRTAQMGSGGPLIVGFNRRHAPIAIALRALHGPRLMDYRVNAGPVPASHWTNDLTAGGGRLVGEGCHFVDFLCDQARSDPVRVSARGFRSDSSMPLAAVDNFNVQIDFSDGSVGSLTYAADAPRGPGKERFEVSAPGAFGVCEDFRSGSIWQGSRRRRLGGRTQDKGWKDQYKMLAEVVGGRLQAPPVEGFLISMLATLAARRSLSTGAPEDVVLTES